MSSNINIKLIHDVEMDHYRSSIDCLATTGVNSCIGFVIVLNDGRDIFIQHRSDILLPSEVNIKNIRACLKHVADHICELKPESKITIVFILGGKHGDKHFESLQDNINELINIDINKQNESPHYHEFIKNIEYFNVCFNVPTDPGFEEITSEANLELIVDKDPQENEQKLVVIQRISKFGEYGTLIGVLVIGVNTNKRLFVINTTATNEQGIPCEKLDYQKRVTERFRLCSTAFGATEVENALAIQLLNYEKSLSSKVSFDPNIQQIEIK